MGPSVRFVSRINGSFSQKKYGSTIFRKKDQTGGKGGRWSEGVFGKKPHFFRPFPYQLISIKYLKVFSFFHTLFFTPVFSISISRTPIIKTGSILYNLL